MRKHRGLTLIDVLILSVITTLIAIIGIPNFIRFQAASKQSEAKANLKALYMAEKAYFQEKDTYHSNPSVVGFAPERGNRYQYNLLGNSTDHLEGRSGTIIPPPAFDEDGIAFDSFKYPIYIAGWAPGPYHPM